MRRGLALLLALVAAFCVLVGPGQAPPAAAAPGPLDNAACQVAGGPIIGTVLNATGLCDKIGDSGAKVMKKAWKGVWDSALGDFIRSFEDEARWILKRTFTVAVAGPSLDLEKTGLFGKDATLAGMMVWLGWVIATFGLMWQLGKMALFGQIKYAGQALVGFVQNAVLVAVGFTVIATLLKLGDLMTTGLIDATFDDTGDAVERILLVMLPKMGNPVGLFIVAAVIALIGGVQMLLVFLRQSAIPIQALLLPIAGAGRVGGETTRKWAPALITSILAAIAYKPLLALIICIGFSEFGHSQTLAEWLRGLATLVLGILAPAPLMKIFAPIGAEVGAGLASGGAVGAAASVGSYVEQRRERGAEGGGQEPANAVEHAKHVQQTMPGSYGEDQQSEATEQAERTGQEAAKVPTQGFGPPPDMQAPGDAAPASPETTGEGIKTGTGTANPATGQAGITLQVLDGVNDTFQQGSREIGDGGKQT